MLFVGFFLLFSVPVYSEQSGESVIAADLNMNVECIFGLDEKTAIIGGEKRSGQFLSSSIYLTSDGGKSWKEIGPEIELSSIYSIFFLDNLIGWAVGAWTQESITDPFVLSTEDGGLNWKRSFIPVRIPSGTNIHLPVNIYFINESYGIVQTFINNKVEDETAIFISENGGESWKFSHGQRGASGNNNLLSITKDGYYWALEKQLNNNREVNILVSSDQGLNWTDPGITRQ